MLQNEKPARLGFTFDFGDTFVFNGAHQGLQRSNYAWTNIAANKDEHNVVTYRKFTICMPDTHIANARHSKGVFDSSLNLSGIVAEQHADHFFARFHPIGFNTARFRFRRSTHYAIMR